MLIEDLPNLTDQERSNASAFRDGHLSEAARIAASDLRRIVALRDLDHATSVILSRVAKDLEAAPSDAEKAAADMVLRLRRSSVQASEREQVP